MVALRNKHVTFLKNMSPFKSPLKRPQAAGVHIKVQCGYASYLSLNHEYSACLKTYWSTEKSDTFQTLKLRGWSTEEAKGKIFKHLFLFVSLPYLYFFIFIPHTVYSSEKAF